MSFTVISTFSGCGGSSLGYQMAGGKVLLAVEWDDHAVQTYKENFPGTPVYHGDIAKLTAAEVCNLTGIQPYELDILDGSPPCQGFSTAGKRKHSDERNQLFTEYCRLLRDLQPRVMIMENVSGMVKGSMKVMFAEILRELKACGYRVRCELLNAKYYGVPQSRERVIFIGVRQDLEIEPTHPRGSTRITVFREAVKGINHIGRKLSKSVAAIYPQTIPGESFANALIREGKKGSFFNWSRLSWDRVAPTILKTIPTLACPDVPHTLSIAAAKRIASFPDDFRFSGKYTEQWARIGNSVPPNLMYAIAQHVRDTILVKVKMNKTVSVHCRSKT